MDLSALLLRDDVPPDAKSVIAAAAAQADSLFRDAPLGIVYQRADGQITMANHAAEAMLGLTLDQGQASTVVHPQWSAITPDGQPFASDEYPAIVALSTGEVVRDVVMGVYDPAAGRHCWLLVSSVPVAEPTAAQPHLVCSTFVDITAQRHAEQRTVAALGTAGVGLWEWRGDERMVWHDPRARALLGASATGEREPADFAFDRTHPDDVPTFLAAFHQRLSVSDSEAWSQIRLRCADGVYRWFQLSGRVVERGADGQPDRIVGTVIAVDDRVRREQHLERTAITATAIAQAQTQLDRQPDEPPQHVRAILDGLRALELGRVICLAVEREFEDRGLWALVDQQLTHLPLDETGDGDQERLLGVASAQGWPLGSDTHLLAPVLVGDRRVGVLAALGVSEPLCCEAADTVQTFAALAALAIQAREQIQALAVSEATHREVFENALEPMLLSATESGLILDCNHSFAAWVGRSRSALRGQPLQAVVSSPAGSGRTVSCDSAAPGTAQAALLHTADRGTLEVEARCSLLQLADGTQACLGLYRDLTAERSAHLTTERLREAVLAVAQCETVEKGLEVLLDAACSLSGCEAAGIYLVEDDVAVVASFVGVSDEFLQAVDRLPLAHPVMQAIAAAEQWVAMGDVTGEVGGTLQGTGWRQAFAFPVRVGQQLVASLNVGTVNATPIDVGRLNALRTLATGAGTVLQRVYAEREAQHQSALLRCVLDSIPDAIYAKNTSGEYVAANRAFERLTGVSVGQLPGQLAVGVAPFDESPWPADGPSSAEEHRLLTAAGERVISLQTTPFAGRHGELLGLVGVARDVTEAHGARAIQDARLRLVHRATESDLAELLTDALREVERLTGSRGSAYYFAGDDGRLERQVARADLRGVSNASQPDQLWPACLAQRATVAEHDGTWATALVPIWRHNRAVAAIGLARDGEPYSSGELAAVEQLADLAWDITAWRHASDGLAVSESLYRGLFENAQVGIYRVSLDDGRLRLANQTMAGILGYHDARALLAADAGRGWPDSETLDSLLQSATGSPEVTPIETHVLRRDGKAAWLSQSARLATAEHALDVVVVDITNQVLARVVRDGALAQMQQAHQDLQRQVALQAALLDAVPLPVYIKNLTGQIVSANKAFEEVCGAEPGAVLGRYEEELAPPEEADQHTRADQRLRRVGRRTRYMVQRGSQVLEVHKAVATDEQRGVVGICGAIVDLTEQQNIISALMHTRAQLRAVAAELVKAEDAESRRVAVDLHDTLGQSLAALQIHLAGMSAQAADEGLVREIEGMRLMVAELISDSRALTRRLSPTVLYDLGLEPALRMLAEEYAEQNGWEVEVEVTAGLSALPETTSLVLFRFAREFLHNAAKHARAGCVWVTVAGRAGRVTLAVEDDGVGPTGDLLAGALSSLGGLGLFAIRERAEHLGGEMAILEREGGGLSVRVSVPLGATETAEVGRHDYGRLG